jgi:hypothetical protein
MKSITKGGDSMAEAEDLRAVAGKALADPAFRQKLLDNPEAAVKEAGFQLSPDQLKALNNMDKAELEKGLVDLDQRLTMACWGKAQNICGWD